MSRIFEGIFTWFLKVSTALDGLRENRHDGLFEAEYKAKQRACLWSFVPFLAVLLVGWAAGTFLNVLDGFQGAQGPVSDARAWLLPVLLGALALAFLFALYTWISLYRFTRKHDIQ